VIHEDSELIVVAKPAGMVVHPAAGNREGTLQNALLHRYPELVGLPRGGLVHRLDKDTSGLLVVARNLRAHKSLVDQLQARTVTRQYDAIVQGTLVAGGTVEAPLGRHPVDRKRMAVRRGDAGGRGAKQAVTHYRIAEKFRQHTYLHVKLETGRTHQIRVHMAHLKKPLVGDPVYGSRMKVPRECTPRLRECLQTFRRQALHAARLGLNHPASGEPLEWRVEMPEDMQELLAALREDTAKHDD
jgi:23S rRNA pseudouridine1911/1915/1917 synthase